MDIGIIGGGINSLCCASQLAKQGHQVQLYERDTLMNSTSRVSSKLLHGGLRYLENHQFRLVRESVRERDASIKRAPHLAKPLRLVMPLYQQSRWPGWKIALGLFLFDHLAGKSQLPEAKRLTAQELIRHDPLLKSEGLQGGYEFSSGQMNDQALGLRVAEQARQAGVYIAEHTEVTALTQDGQLTTAKGATHAPDRLINVAGPWAHRLSQISSLDSPHELELVRGSHSIIVQPCKQSCLLESPNDRRILFVLPWQSFTLVGTTEVRRTSNDPIACSPEEQSYLRNAWSQYFSDILPNVINSFASLRPLLCSAQEPSKAKREYEIHRTGKLLTVLGGKSTTAMALADKVC